MNFMEIKKIVSNYIDLNPEKINSSTLIDKSVIPGSIMIHRMYSELKSQGYEVKNSKNIKTFGDLERDLSGKSINNETIQKIKLGNFEGNFENSDFFGIDIESSENLPETKDYFSHQFYKDNFSEKEIAYCSLKSEPRLCFCGRFAAKEAIIKANSYYKNIKFSEIEILNSPDGKPKFKDFDLSISHVRFSENNLSIAIAQKKSNLTLNRDISSKSFLEKWLTSILMILIIFILLA